MAVLTTVIGSVIAAVSKARSTAVESARKAVDVVNSALDTQSSTIADLQKRTTDQERRTRETETRLSSMTQVHGVSVDHIADRELWTVEKFGSRPDGLPAIPDEIALDVSLAIYRNRYRGRMGE